MIGRLRESSISGFKRHVSFILSLSLFFSLLLWKELKPSWLEIPARSPSHSSALKLICLHKFLPALHIEPNLIFLESYLWFPN